jgi:hypothetical protein
MSVLLFWNCRVPTWRIEGFSRQCTPLRQCLVNGVRGKLGPSTETGGHRSEGWLRCYLILRESLKFDNPGVAQGRGAGSALFVLMSLTLSTR